MARVDRSLDQFEAVGRMRWRMLINSLRTPAGKFELTAQALINGFFFARLAWGRNRIRPGFLAVRKRSQPGDAVIITVGGFDRLAE